jgi:hypothetical protein
MSVKVQDAFGIATMFAAGVGGLINQNFAASDSGMPA